MKKFLFFLCTAVTLFGSVKTNAQTFSIQKDTVRLTYNQALGGIQSATDTIMPISPSVNIDWKVLSTNFPSDWQAQTIGICDNKSCYNWSLLWPSGTIKNSLPYTPTGGTRDFHIQFNLNAGVTPVTSSGTYYIVVKMTSSTTDTTQVYAVTYMPTAVNNVAKVNTEVSLYPNPTSNDINVVYDAAADVKTISVYNIIGKTMAIYKPVSDNSANLSLENVPAGIYFVRLANSHGEVVATRKFTKQ